MERKTLFVNVLLPLPIKGPFTYRVPFELNEEISLYKRVVVQFGQKKIYTAIIVEINESPPAYSKVKYILSVLDQEPIINEIQFKFWKWIAAYYLSTTGEVMQAALPSALKLQSETSIILHPEFNGEINHLNETELLLVDALVLQEKLTISEASVITERKKIIPLIKSMIDKKVVIMEEELKEKFNARKVSFLKLKSEFQSNEKIEKLFNQLEKRAYKQLEVIIDFIKKTKIHEDWSREIQKSLLSQSGKSNDAAINALVKKGVFELYQKEVSRLGEYNSTQQPDDINLSEAQQKALEEINIGFKMNKPVLIHGVTSSGKTEIYIKLIEDAISQGGQILYLLPEIALTTQIINRLRTYFGDQVGIYHSRYNTNERVEIWNSILYHADKKNNHKEYKIILGPRSALFLPFQKLGLVIIDEEHDQSYKQYDPSPRYHARDSAVYLSGLHGANVVLGSATPSIESYYNAKKEKYFLVELNTRFGDIQMPEILVADLKKESRKKTMKSHFSSLLLDQMKIALEQKEQIILFQNRRGFSLRFECEICNWIPECKYCDVTLTYHKHINSLKCHYCGYTKPVISQCESCGSNHLSMKGFGTEKIEDEIAILFPKARIKRMDLDSTRGKNAHHNIISDFEERKVDILVGTQMVTKGLDFDHVSIVGILNADNLLYYPDFRAFERSYQLMAQVSGRAGRKKKRGKVIIQSYSPYHAAIRYVMENDYQLMYQSQLEDRQRFKYPPFYRLIILKLKHKDKDVLTTVSNHLAKSLRKEFGNLVLGPEYPLVARVKNRYIKQIILKFNRSKKLNENKQKLQLIIENLVQKKEMKAVQIQIDVDPV